MTEGIGRTTFGRVAVDGARRSEEARQVGEEPLEVASNGHGASTDAVPDRDIQTRRRRILRILLAARRRDDGSSRHNGG
jgi:hypothetical protein